MGDLLSGFMSGPIWAIIGAALVFFVVLFIALYIYFAIALMAIAKKTKTQPAWLAWVPIGNVYLLTKIGKIEWWWVLIAVFAGMVPVIGWLASLAAMGYIFWKVAEAIKKPGYWGILCLIPVVNLVVIGIMAWG